MSDLPRPVERRSNYREPTATGRLALARSGIWGSVVAGRGSDLHKVLFVSAGGSLKGWAAPTSHDEALLRDVTAKQADAVIEWLAGRDRLLP